MLISSGRLFGPAKRIAYALENIVEYGRGRSLLGAAAGLFVVEDRHYLDRSFGIRLQ